ncbi:MAG: tetratricopeptide repeat protein [Chlorobiaceae bacterium]|nr:tetratricopeptide repeat protein [Chlorobiaceae bacterium]
MPESRYSATLVNGDKRRGRVVAARLAFSWLFSLLTFMLISASRADAKTPVEIFKEASRSIIVIKTYDDKGKLLSSGSGVVLNDDGDSVTNFHVIERAAKIVVHYDKKEYTATPRYVDRIRDVCSIKVPGLKAVPVTLAKNSQIEIGTTVYAIGSPMAVGLTFSNGMVSSLRETSGGHYIQFTAPISPGSSGGGLFDEEARLIGIPTYFINQGQLLNFALPVEWVVDLPRRHGAQVTAEIGVKRDDLYQQQTLAMEEKEDWLSQIQLGERWTKEFPSSVRAWELLGSAYANNGEFNKAIVAYRQAVTINPDSAQYWLELGLLFGKTGQRAEQADAYRASVHINPDYAGSWYNLAVVYRDASQFKQAIDASKQVIRINPAHVPALLIQGYAYGKLGQQVREIDAYLQALRIDEFSSDVYVCLGVAYSNVHREGDEVKAYEQALQVKPDDAAALFNLGHYYQEHGNKEKGMEYYSRLKSVDPAMAAIFFDDLTYRAYPSTVKQL